MNTRVIPEALNLGSDWYHGLSNYAEIAAKSVNKAKWVGYIDNMKFIASKSLKGKRFLYMGFDAARAGQKGLAFSKFTIYSKRFISQTVRWKNILRLGYHIY